MSPGTEAERILQSSYLVNSALEVDSDRPANLPPEAKQISTLMDQADIPKLSQLLIAGGISLYAVEIKNPTLEDLFLRLTEGERIE
ncbi:hypothetical protein D3C86_1915770 [compost metagenome]